MADLATSTTVDTGRRAGQSAADLERQLDQHRRELTGYCYRMLGSAFDADDAVQETMVRAWRAYDRFEGRSSLRSWLYSIATNVCYDLLKGRQRRARPIELGPSSPYESAVLGDPIGESAWVEPIPDGRIVPDDADPAEQAVARETTTLAFVAALQHLPARQRAVLILREVLRWKASEVAQLLDTTVVSVNSALQRARATLATHDADAAEPLKAGDDEQRELLDRYVDAFERYDMDALVSLLHEDATLSMPPYALWLRGPADIAEWHVGQGNECRGSRLVPVAASGLQGFAQYRPPTTPGGPFEAWSLQLIEISKGRIVGLNAFLEVERIFPLFGLSLTLDPSAQ